MTCSALLFHIVVPPKVYCDFLPTVNDVLCKYVSVSVHGVWRVTAVKNPLRRMLNEVPGMVRAECNDGTQVTHFLFLCDYLFFYYITICLNECTRWKKSHDFHQERQGNVLVRPGL